jgi:hypothetical protein
LVRGTGSKLLLLCGFEVRVWVWGGGKGLAKLEAGTGKGCVCRLLGDFEHAGMRFPVGVCGTLEL